MRKASLSIILVVMFIGVMAGCSPSPEAEEPLAETNPTKVATKAPTQTPEPTNTPTAIPSRTLVPTPAPTETPAPTDTPTPTPTPVPQLYVSVADGETGEAIEGARVELACPNMGARFAEETDGSGEAVFDPAPEGSCVISLTADGFREAGGDYLEVVGAVTADYELTFYVSAELIVESAYLREGPGTVYGRAGEVLEGETFEVIGQNEQGSWLQVEVAMVEDVQEAGEEGQGDAEEMGDFGEGEEADESTSEIPIIVAWIAAEDVAISGDVERIEAVEPPPTPTPAPVLPTPTPEVLDSIVVFYLSNPSEILGVFPVMSFDAGAMYNHMLNMRGSLYVMQDALPGALNGELEACANYIGAYNNILYSGVFYDPVPPEWREIDAAYFYSFIYSLDRTRPAYLSCLNAGRVDEFNHGLARSAIDETLFLLNPAINSAAGGL